MSNSRKYSKISDVIASFIRGEYEKPVAVEGKNKEILRQLEALRVSVCLLKKSYEEDVKAQRVELASVAHDLKTPLAIIRGYTECLQDGIDDKDYLSLIASKAAEMNEQVVSLVEATRHDVVKPADLEMSEEIDAKKYFAAELEKYRKLAKDKNIAFKVGVVPDVKLFVSKEKLSRILQNLITNAVKYSPDGALINVRLKRDANYLRIEVKDNDVGISRRDQKCIFERFYTVDKARTDTTSTGLGLYITKQFVDELGGHIYLKSKLGKGSTFAVLLPIDESGYIGLSGTKKIDMMTRPQKFWFWFFLGFVMTYAYRFRKYRETRVTTTLAGGLILMPLFVFGWIFDLIEIALTNRITFLAD